MRVTMLGPPGAGKGTQSARVAAAYAVPHVATGDLLRAHVRRESELGRRARQFMEEGRLVPDEIVVDMVAERLARPDAADGFVLDGFPRTVPQAQALEELADGAPLDVVLRLVIDEDEVVDRLTGRLVCRAQGHTYHRTHNPPRREGVCDIDGSELYQREDDEREVVLNRLEVYRRQTEPLEMYYWERGLLRDLEAAGSIEEVSRRALAILSEYEVPVDRARAGGEPG